VRGIPARFQFGLSLVLALALIFAAGGCRRYSDSALETESTTPGAVAASPVAAGSLPPVEDVRSAQEKNFSEIMNQLRKSADPPQEKIRKLRSRFLLNAKHIEATTGIKLAVIAKAEKEIAALEKQLADESSAAFEELQKAVAPLLSGEAADFDRAGRLVSEFRERHKNTAIDAQALALEDRVLRCSSAERELEARKLKLKDDDPVWNIALLEGFDPQYRDTPAAEVVQQLIAKNFRAYSERRSAEIEADKNAKWEEFDIQGFGVSWPQQTAPPAKVEEGVLTIGPNTKETNGDDLDTCLRFGEDDWVDVEIQFEAQIQMKAPKTILFGARGGREKDDTYNFFWQDLAQLQPPADAWNHFLVRIEGGTMTIAGGGKVVSNTRLRVSPGPFGVRVLGEDSLIRLRNMQCWVKKREASAAGADEKAEKKKKKSKKGKKKETEKDTAKKETGKGGGKS